MMATDDEKSSQPKPALLFDTPSDATKKLQLEFEYWGERVTGNSFELSIAVVAANWAAFGNWIAIQNNLYAQTSLIFVILGMVLGLLGARWMSELYRKQIDYAESDHLRWQMEFRETAESSDPWPYTKQIQDLGYRLRMVKGWMPIIGGAFFILALFKY